MGIMLCSSHILVVLLQTFLDEWIGLLKSALVGAFANPGNNSEIVRLSLTNQTHQIVF
jgi:hypothetical protein